MTNSIEIIFLGTGSAVPTIKRNHPSVFVKYKDENMLFDCGEGTQRQIRKAHLNPCRLTRIFITHWHGDHVLGIPGLLQTLYFNDCRRTLEIYGPSGTKRYVEQIMKIFASVGQINIKIHEVSSGKIVETEDFIITAEQMKHGTPCLAYAFAEKDKIRINRDKIAKLKLPNSPLMQNLKQGKDITIDGKKIKAKEVTYTESGHKVSIVLDTMSNLGIKSIAKNSDIFICESTYLDEDELAKENYHMTMKQVAKIAKEAKVKKLILMHLSQRYESNEKNFLAEAKKQFKDVVIAEDLMKINI